MQAQWAIAQTPSRREASAARALKESGYETILPMQWERRRFTRLGPSRTRKAELVQAPAYPGYLFVDIAPSWSGVAALKRRGVISGFLTQAPGKVYILRPHEIAALEAAGGAVKPLPCKNGIRAGQKVLVVLGPLAGLRADVETADGDMLGLRLPGVSVRIELHSDCCDLVS